MTPNHAEFLQAIQDKNKVRIEFHPKPGTEVLQLTCVPLEYGPGGQVQDGMDRYWLWDYSSNNSTQIFGLLPGQIVVFTVLVEEFDLAELSAGSSSLKLAEGGSMDSLPVKGATITTPGTPTVINSPEPAMIPIDPDQRILAVDDDKEIRQLYSEVLVDSGYQVDTAEDGEAGWKKLHAASHAPDASEAPDLLITDNCMPNLTGVELVGKVRSANMTLPVIMASGSVPQDTEALALAATLPKPFSLAQLVQTVDEVMRPAKSDSD